MLPGKILPNFLNYFYLNFLSKLLNFQLNISSLILTNNSQSKGFDDRWKNHKFLTLVVVVVFVVVVVGDGVVVPPKSGSRQLHTPFWHCEPQQSPPSQLQAAMLFASSHQLSWYQLGIAQSIVVVVVVVAGVVLPPRKIVSIFYI